MAAYSPPFTLTHAMLNRVADIAELVGQWRFAQSSQVPMLRRESRIRTIQASLAIEHNTLSVEQVTAVIEGKTVLGLTWRPTASRCLTCRPAAWRATWSSGKESARGSILEGQREAQPITSPLGKHLSPGRQGAPERGATLRR